MGCFPLLTVDSARKPLCRELPWLLALRLSSTATQFLCDAEAMGPVPLFRRGSLPTADQSFLLFSNDGAGHNNTHFGKGIY